MAKSGIGNVAPNSELLEMAMAYSRSRMLCTAARLGVADALGTEERGVEELAKSCQADCDSLYRLLRALAAVGIVSQTAPRRFVLTQLGQPLRKNIPNSAWAGVVFWSDLLSDQWTYLTDCVKTGTSSGRVMETAGIVSRWFKDPEAPAIFRAVMGTAPTEDYAPIAKSWDFDAHQVVADLGGGGGALLEAILTHYPRITGLLVDRSESIESAKPRFAKWQADGRCKLVAADLLESVPAGADVYIMKHVLHGCKDDPAIKILRNCHSVMPSGGTLLIVEFVLPDVVSEADPKLETRLMSDVNMMVVTGGKERSVAEWKVLLESSEFRMVRIAPVVAANGEQQDVSIVQAAPDSRSK